MRGAPTRTWCFKDDHQRGMLSGEGSLWWEVHLQGHDALKMITKGEWWTVFERCKDMMFQRRWPPMGNGFRWRHCSLWREVFLQGLYVLKFDPQRGMVKTVFDERCTYKGMRFQNSDHQRIIFWWRASFLKGSIVRQCLFSGQYSGCTFHCSQHCIGMFRQVVTNNNNQWNNCCRDILCYATLCCF